MHLVELSSRSFKLTPATQQTQEMKQQTGNRLRKEVTYDPKLLNEADRLGVPEEDPLQGGHTLLPSETVEILLKERRCDHLVYPFRLALLKLTSQEVAGLIAGGDYEAALPVALEAVKQGQSLFRRDSAVQLFPLYLLAAQANLGLQRTAQCEDFLSLASWLTLKEPESVTHSMQSQLSRLYGQLFALQGRSNEALRAFAEDVYHCSMDSGPEDVRTSLGYYNLAKVYSNIDESTKSFELCCMVVNIWLACLVPWALGMGDGGRNLDPPSSPESANTPANDSAVVLQAARDSAGEESGAELFSRLVWRPCKDASLVYSQLLEVVDMLRDIAGMTENHMGTESNSTGDSHFALGLAQLRLGEPAGASAAIRKAIGSYKSGARSEIAEQVLSTVDAE